MKGKVRIGKRFHIGKAFDLYASKGSKVIVGCDFLCRNNVVLRTDDEGILEIHDHVFLNNNVNVTSRSHVTIGSHTMVGQNVVIVDHDHDYQGKRESFKCEDIKIGRNVLIGANVTILKGTVIGDNAVIGANCVVKGTIEADSVVYQEKNLITKKIIKHD